MKKLSILLLLLLFPISMFSFGEPDESILKAMKDEMKRSMDKLEIEGLERPYYMEYQLVFHKSKSLQASNGSIVSISDNNSGQLNVGVRVGDYEFDNSNFFDVGLGFFGSSDDEESFKKRRISPDPDYDYLRRELWLATDAAYKQTAEIFAKKQATIKNRMRKDTIPDFIKLETHPKLRDIKSLPNFDIEYYKNLAEELSAKFNSSPDIYTSGAVIEFLPKRVYYVNTEGIEYVKDDYYTGLEIVSATQSDDGMPIFDHYTAFSNKPENLPSKDSLLSAADHLIDNINERLEIEQPNDYYVGPVIFKDQAAAQIFAQSFAPKLVTQREPITEGGFSSENESAAFQRKIGGRVLPEFMNVYDKPTLEELNNTPLIGHYKVDDDGLKAKDITLIKEGYLETLASERIPTRRVKESNAHKRGGAAMFSNLIVEADSKHSKSNEELETEMIEHLERRELEYGYIIEKLLDQNIRYTTLYRLLNGNIEIPFGEKNYIMEGYKLYQDGSKEKFKGMIIPKMNVLLFKDILYTGNDSYTMNFLAPTVISPYLTGGDQYLGSSITIPDLFFEDGEIHLIDDDFKKPPFTENPLNVIK